MVATLAGMHQHRCLHGKSHRYRRRRYCQHYLLDALQIDRGNEPADPSAAQRHPSPLESQPQEAVPLVLYELRLQRNLLLRGRHIPVGRHTLCRQSPHKLLVYRRAQPREGTERSRGLAETQRDRTCHQPLAERQSHKGRLRLYRQPLRLHPCPTSQQGALHRAARLACPVHHGWFRRPARHQARGETASLLPFRCLQ